MLAELCSKCYSDAAEVTEEHCFHGGQKFRCSDDRCTHRNYWYRCVCGKKFDRPVKLHAHVAECPEAASGKSPSDDASDFTMDASCDMTSFDTWEAPVISLDETSLSQKNKNYFCREYRQPGLGIRSVVQAAFRKSAADDEDLSNDPTCTEEEANFHVMVAKFSKSLTTSQLNTFADVLAGLDEGTNDSRDGGARAEDIFRNVVWRHVLLVSICVLDVVERGTAILWKLGNDSLVKAVGRDFLHQLLAHLVLVANGSTINFGGGASHLGGG